MAPNRKDQSDFYLEFGVCYFGIFSYSCAKISAYGFVRNERYQRTRCRGSSARRSDQKKLRRLLLHFRPPRLFRRLKLLVRRPGSAPKRRRHRPKWRHLLFRLNPRLFPRSPLRLKTKSKKSLKIFYPKI